MDWYENYINSIAQTNEEFYEEMAQAWTDGYFEDSTLVKKILEEQFPFNNEYEEYEVHVDSVAEVTVNINKVIGDFISVIFRNCKHRNYRGQKYQLDGETYLCYDKINKLAKVAKTNLIRCNNELNWMDENGNIYTEKAYLGYDLSSTNDLIGKDGITSNRRRVIYVQNNDRTEKIKINQRFMFQHNQCFRVEEIDNYNRESNADNKVTMIKMYVVYSPMQVVDNQELNICDYYTIDYKLNIDQTDIEQLKDFTETLTATVTNNNEIVSIPIVWKSENEDIVTIDEDGNYELIGNVGQHTKIKCYMLNNENIYDEIEITIIDSLPQNKSIMLTNNEITELKQMDSVEFDCGIYIDNTQISKEVSCIPSGAKSSCYNLEKTTNGYKLTNIKISQTPLTLTFSADDCEDIVLNIKLLGLF